MAEGRIAGGRVLEPHPTLLKFAPDKVEQRRHGYPKEMWFRVSDVKVAAGIILWGKQFDGRLGLIIKDFTPGASPAGEVIGVLRPTPESPEEESPDNSQE